MKVALITPIKDTLPGPAHVAVVDFAIEATKRDIDLVFKTTWLSSNLAKSRMMLAREALKSDADRILMVDDDIIFSPKDAFTLLDMNADMIGGCYKKRITNGETIGDPLDGGSQVGLLLEMRRIGLGFTALSRSCLLQLVEKHGDGLFEFLFDGTRIVGEDEVFCDRWRQLGGSIWLHTAVNLGHVGLHCFT